jgi:hypothetical protein
MILNLVFKYAILSRGVQCHTVALEKVSMLLESTKYTSTMPPP